MKVFVTGATGYIGSPVVRELLSAGHRVVGLARSDEAAAALKKAGAEVHRGSLDDLNSLRDGAATAEGVIHIAFSVELGPNFDYVASCSIDKRAIEALGEALAGSNRPLVITSGTAVTAVGIVGTENDAPGLGSPIAIRGSNEDVALSFAPRGVRVSILRLPPTVYSSADKKSFIPTLINIARARGVSAYVGEGSNRWPTVHLLDAAHLYRLALEKAPAGTRLHGVGDEGVPLRDIATSIGRNLNLPVVSITADEANNHFGFFGAFTTPDVPASSALTQQRFDWHPVRPGLIADIDQGHYFEN